MPVSTIATSALTRSSEPLIRAIGLNGPNTRRTPRGVVWPAIETTASGTTAATSGSARSAATCSLVSLAA